jgi:VWFA-related protein
MKIRVPFRRCLPAAALAALLPLPAVYAQTQAAAPAHAPAVADAVGAISLPVTAVDNHGDPVKNLTAADLTLTDNGRPQKIQSFALDPSSSIVFGIIGQTGSSLRTELGDERLASVHFVDHTLPGTDDQSFVVQYDHEVDLLADPTATVNKLHDAINQLGSPQFGSQNGSSDNGSATASHGSGGTMNDAIYLAATQVMKKQPGRHILVLISDGIDHDSKESINDAVQAAQNAHTAIFAIYFKPEVEPQRNPNQGRRGGTGYPGGGYPGGGGGYPGGYPGGGGGYPGGGGGYPGGGRGGQVPSEQPHIDGKEILEHICSQTGGYMIEGRKDKADEAYSRLAALLKNQYTISFVPDKDAAASDFHRISLTANKKDVWALVQEGYTGAQ